MQSSRQHLALALRSQPPPVPPSPFYLPQIEGDDGEEVVADDVIKQSGGISNGANGARATFSAGVQFSISDPAFGKVSPASWHVTVWALATGLCSAKTVGCAGASSCFACVT